MLVRIIISDFDVCSSHHDGAKRTGTSFETNRIADKLISIIENHGSVFCHVSVVTVCVCVCVCCHRFVSKAVYCLCVRCNPLYYDGFPSIVVHECLCSLVYVFFFAPFPQEIIPKLCFLHMCSIFASGVLLRCIFLFMKLEMAKAARHIEQFLEWSGTRCVDRLLRLLACTFMLF